ncbi:MAG: hypothetical protein JNN27_18525 [Planctomycetes bacterium]|nr:hypothetical protein [Planctomycetota bacterium]
MARCSLAVLCVAATLACHASRSETVRPKVVAPCTFDKVTATAQRAPHPDLVSGLRRAWGIRGSESSLPTSETFRLWVDDSRPGAFDLQSSAIGPVTLVGRAVNESGAPLRDFAIVAEYDLFDERLGPGPLATQNFFGPPPDRTDGAGAFCLSMGKLSAHSLSSIELVASRIGRLDHSSATSIHLAGHVASIGGPLIDLGDVPLSAPPVALRCRVLTPRGEPVQHARVAISCLRPDGAVVKLQHAFTDEAGRADFAAPTLSGTYSLTAQRTSLSPLEVSWRFNYDLLGPESAPAPVAPDGAETVVILEP